MAYFVELLGVLLAAAGLFLFGWTLLGRILTPVGKDGPVYAVLPANGDGEALEHDIRGLLWLRGSDFARFSIAVVDCGLTEQGREAARLLVRREPDMVLCTAEELVQLLQSAAK